MEQSPVKAIEVSQNRKLGLMSSTYASQSSCPKDCPFFGNGCYASSGPMGIHTARLNKSSVVDPVEIARKEAEQIDGMSGKLDLRIHAVGDCTTDECAKLVSAAAERYMAKRGRQAYSYTHAHNVSRESWGKVSVLRSCETIPQVEKAFEDGFAAAMVVDEFKSDNAYEVAPGITGIPCPEMTGKAKSCDECRLCMKDDKLRASKRVILFAAHGASSGKVKTMLRVVNS